MVVWIILYLFSINLLIHHWRELLQVSHVFCCDKNLLVFVATILFVTTNTSFVATKLFGTTVVVTIFILFLFFPWQKTCFVVRAFPVIHVAGPADDTNRAVCSYLTIVDETGSCRLLTRLGKGLRCKVLGDASSSAYWSDTNTGNSKYFRPFFFSFFFLNNNNKKNRKEKPTGRGHARNTHVT